jgi:hypothetical protein
MKFDNFNYNSNNPQLLHVISIYEIDINVVVYSIKYILLNMKYIYKKSGANLNNI